MLPPVVNTNLILSKLRRKLLPPPQPFCRILGGTFHYSEFRVTLVWLLVLMLSRASGPRLLLSVSYPSASAQLVVLKWTAHRQYLGTKPDEVLLRRRSSPTAPPVDAEEQSTSHNSRPAARRKRNLNTCMAPPSVGLVENFNLFLFVFRLDF